MNSLGASWRLGAAASAGRFERLLDHLVAVARVDPERVVDQARRRGVVVSGTDPDAHLASLRRQPVEVLDPVAATFVRSSCGAAAVQGFALGSGGLATLPVAVPADSAGGLYWLVRAVSGVANAYGFDTWTAEGVARLRMGLLVGAGIGAVDVRGRRVALERWSRQMLLTPYGQEVLSAGCRRLATRLAAGSARGWTSRAVPVLGGVVGGAAGMAAVRGAGRRAQQHYRRMLLDWQRGELAGGRPLALADGHPPEAPPAP